MACARRRRRRARGRRWRRRRRRGGGRETGREESEGGGREESGGGREDHRRRERTERRGRRGDATCGRRGDARRRRGIRRRGVARTQSSAHGSNNREAPTEGTERRERREKASSVAETVAGAATDSDSHRLARTRTDSHRLAPTRGDRPGRGNRLRLRRRGEPTVRVTLDGGFGVHGVRSAPPSSGRIGGVAGTRLPRVGRSVARTKTTRTKTSARTRSKRWRTKTNTTTPPARTTTPPDDEVPTRFEPTRGSSSWISRGRGLASILASILAPILASILASILAPILVPTRSVDPASIALGVHGGGRRFARWTRNIASVWRIYDAASASGTSASGRVSAPDSRWDARTDALATRVRNARGAILAKMEHISRLGMLSANR